MKAATFEGSTPRGQVTDRLVDFHSKVARGGVGMTTVAYCAVTPAGRVQRHCLVLDADTAVALRRVTDAAHSEGAAACAQLGHAGLVADARSNGMQSLAPSRRFSAPAKGLVPAASALTCGGSATSSRRPHVARSRPALTRSRSISVTAIC